MAKEKPTETKVVVVDISKTAEPSGVKMVTVLNRTARSFHVGGYVVRPGSSSLPEADAKKLAADWPTQITLGDAFTQTDLSAENAALRKRIEELEAKAALG